MFYDVYNPYCSQYIVFIFGTEDGDSMFLRNVGFYRRIYTTPKRWTTS
jgi:hypothetical protein